jgi:SAM-dependent methyltransferase
MSLFRSGPSPHQTALAMVGVKPGKTAVVVGAGNGALAAELALITGLNGRTIIVDPRTDAEAMVEAAAARAGALVEFVAGPATAPPVEEACADVVVVNGVLGPSGEDQPAVAREAVRLIRPGGRVVVLEERPRKSRFGLGRGRRPAVITGDAICNLLVDTGLRAVRVLAEANDVVYVEGVKARPQEAGA